MYQEILAITGWWLLFFGVGVVSIPFTWIFLAVYRLGGRVYKNNWFFSHHLCGVSGKYFPNHSINQLSLSDIVCLRFIKYLSLLEKQAKNSLKCQEKLIAHKLQRKRSPPTIVDKTANFLDFKYYQYWMTWIPVSYLHIDD